MSRAGVRPDIAERVLGHAIAPEPIAADFVDRQDLLMVGALNGDEAPNVDALFWFDDRDPPGDNPTQLQLCSGCLLCI